MKILGIGIDIVEKGRIKQSIKNSQFIKRIFFSDISILLIAFSIETF